MLGEWLYKLPCPHGEIIHTTIKIIFIFNFYKAIYGIYIGKKISFLHLDNGKTKVVVVIYKRLKGLNLM